MEVVITRMDVTLVKTRPAREEVIQAQETGIKEVRPKVRIQVQAALRVKVRVGAPEIGATVKAVDIMERVDTVGVEMEEIMVETTETTEVEGMEVMEGREVTTRPR